MILATWKPGVEAPTNNREGISTLFSNNWERIWPRKRRYFLKKDFIALN